MTTTFAWVKLTSRKKLNAPVPHFVIVDVVNALHASKNSQVSKPHAAQVKPTKRQIISFAMLCMWKPIGRSHLMGKCRGETDKGCERQNEWLASEWLFQVYSYSGPPVL